MSKSKSRIQTRLASVYKVAFTYKEDGRVIEHTTHVVAGNVQEAMNVAAREANEIRVPIIEFSNCERIIAMVTL